MKDMQVTCLSSSGPKRQVSRFAAGLAVSLLAAACSSAATSAATSPTGTGQAAATSTVWLCLPGMPDDPCRQSLATTAVTATGATSVSSPKPTASATFACFYVYGRLC
jgi:hypothetical protein